MNYSWNVLIMFYFSLVISMLTTLNERILLRLESIAGALNFCKCMESYMWMTFCCFCMLFIVMLPSKDAVAKLSFRENATYTIQMSHLESNHRKLCMQNYHNCKHIVSIVSHTQLYLQHAYSIECVHVSDKRLPLKWIHILL